MKINHRLFPLLLFFAFFCQSIYSQKDDPRAIFDAFWRTMDEHYAFFELKGVDWDAARAYGQDRIGQGISEDELFDLLVEQLRPFQDAHVKLQKQGQDKRTFSGGRPSHFEAEFGSDSLKTAYFEMVAHSLGQLGFGEMQASGPLLSAKNPVYNHSPFEYAASDRLAYVKVSWFFYDFQKLRGLGILKDRGRYLDAFEALLDQCRGKEGLIIDLRNNIGGVSGYPERMAGFFSEEKRIGEYTCRRKPDSHESFTSLKTTFILPRKGPAFLKPVVLLVNSETVSAAEEFTMMMASLPQVTLIGTPTQGALSDIYQQKLPNGWSLSLSNMRFYSAYMACYEGVGIPVDITVENTREHLAMGMDPVLERAVELLEEGQVLH